MHEEVFTKENCEMFSSFLEQTPHENVRQKMLELVQTWAYAFRSSDKYQAIKVSYGPRNPEILRSIGLAQTLIELDVNSAYTLLKSVRRGTYISTS